MALSGRRRNRAEFASAPSASAERSPSRTRPYIAIRRSRADNYVGRHRSHTGPRCPRGRPRRPASPRHSSPTPLVGPFAPIPGPACCRRPRASYSSSYSASYSSSESLRARPAALVALLSAVLPALEARPAPAAGGPPPRTPLQTALDAAFELGFSAAAPSSPTARSTRPKTCACCGCARCSRRASSTTAWRWSCCRRRAAGSSARRSRRCGRRRWRSSAGSRSAPPSSTRPSTPSSRLGTARRRWCSSAAGTTRARCGTPAAAPSSSRSTCPTSSRRSAR